MARPIAIVTGASSGIGFQLAKLAAEQKFDLVITADEPEIREAERTLRGSGVEVTAVEADLATLEGVDALYDAAKQSGRPVDILIANAGRGLGHGFLDQDFAKAKRVVDTNIVGTIYLVQKVGRTCERRTRERSC
jgi:short-subunit dehydrogenase